MKKEIGRPKWKAPDGLPATKGMGQTFAANQTPRQGQKTRSPYHRALGAQKKQYKQVAPNYAIGRTRRMA